MNCWKRHEFRYILLKLELFLFLWISRAIWISFVHTPGRVNFYFTKFITLLKSEKLSTPNNLFHLSSAFFYCQNNVDCRRFTTTTLLRTQHYYLFAQPKHRLHNVYYLGMISNLLLHATPNVIFPLLNSLIVKCSGVFSFQNIS